MKEHNWHVYLVRCSDDTLYCGITNNIERRLKAHNEKKGAKYTRCRTPVTLVVSKGPMSKSDALKLEYKVKQQPRKDKIKFLESYKL